MEQRYVTRIENLPEKVRLTTTRKKIGKIVDLKVKDDGLKDTTEKPMSTDDNKVNVDRSSSVYGTNLSKQIVIELIHKFINK